ncbi:MAG: type II toxin-antitoxin system RelB/DinJ family antitoxin [Verrucomicrobiota bacterium]
MWWRSFPCSPDPIIEAHFFKNGLPFDVQLPNETTRKAIQASRAGEGKKFRSADALFDDLGI